MNQTTDSTKPVFTVIGRRAKADRSATWEVVGWGKNNTGGQLSPFCILDVMIEIDLC